MWDSAFLTGFDADTTLKKLKIIMKTWDIYPTKISAISLTVHGAAAAAK